MEINNVVYQVRSDHLGTPLELINAANTVVWRAHYESFGKAVINDDVDSNGTHVEFNVRFPGQYFDSESGYNYNWHRYYSTETGRYLQSDPIGLNGGVNTYFYVGGNPILRRDSKGLAWGASDFVSHYNNGGGTVSLAAIGLLSEFVHSGSVQSATNRVFNGYKQMLKNRLFSKCTDCAENVSDSFDAHDFDESYDVTWASSSLFSLGDGELFNKGKCRGEANCRTSKWSGTCSLLFYIRDWFADPYGVNLESGTPYRINGDWNESISWSE